jgi:hypothetical protein
VRRGRVQVCGAADLIARIERIHVRHVALARCGFFEVDGPLLELTVPSDLVGDETHDGRVELCTKIGVDAQFLRGGGIGRRTTSGLPTIEGFK